jgi:hypothetical protein
MILYKECAAAARAQQYDSRETRGQDVATKLERGKKIQNTSLSFIYLTSDSSFIISSFRSSQIRGWNPAAPRFPGGQTRGFSAAENTCGVSMVEVHLGSL